MAEIAILSAYPRGLLHRLLPVLFAPGPHMRFDRNITNSRRMSIKPGLTLSPQMRVRREIYWPSCSCDVIFTARLVSSARWICGEISVTSLFYCRWLTLVAAALSVRHIDIFTTLIRADIARGPVYDARLAAKRAGYRAAAVGCIGYFLPKSTGRYE